MPSITHTRLCFHSLRLQTLAQKHVFLPFSVHSSRALTLLCLVSWSHVSVSALLGWGKLARGKASFPSISIFLKAQSWEQISGTLYKYRNRAWMGPQQVCVCTMNRGAVLSLPAQHLWGSSLACMDGAQDVAFGVPWAWFCL